MIPLCGTLTEKEKNYCNGVISKPKQDESKISTRPSTRQLNMRPSSGKKESVWDWLKKFSVFDSEADKKLSLIKEEIEKENKQISNEIEDLKSNILDIQTEIEKFEENVISETFLKQLVKKLETNFVTKKEIRAVTAAPGKKPIKLKSIIKDAQLSASKPDSAESERKTLQSRDETKKKIKCSKVNLLRNTVAGYRLNEGNSEEDKESPSK